MAGMVWYGRRLKLALCILKTVREWWTHTSGVGFFSTKNLSPEGKVWPTCMYMYVVPALVKIQAAATKIYIST